MIAPTRTALTAISCVVALRAKLCLRNNSAPEMTPVSKPNSNPPMAATDAIKYTDKERCDSVSAAPCRLFLSWKAMAVSPTLQGTCSGLLKQVDCTAHLQDQLPIILPVPVSIRRKRHESAMS